jgi:uroporphyrinogen-III synthase
MKLLVIRPQPGADATAARVGAAGHQVLVMPLFGVEAVSWNAPTAFGYDGLLLTSSNAVRNCGPQLSDLAHLPVYAVGKVTAEAAQRSGLHVSHTGNAGAEALLADLRDCRLLWLAGEDHTELVTPASVNIDTHIVYRSAILPVPANFTEMTMQADTVMLHSVRAASHFASLVASEGLDKAAISLTALSQKIALAAGKGWKSVHVAARPNDAALLSCL